MSLTPCKWQYPPTPLNTLKDLNKMQIPEQLKIGLEDLNKMSRPELIRMILIFRDYSGELKNELDKQLRINKENGF